MINYYTVYNSISKPDGFDPDDNADQFYKKAGDCYVPPSKLANRSRIKPFKGLTEKDKVLKEWLKNNHPSFECDAINESEKTALREWMEKNTECIKYLEEGNKKKFFWTQANEEINDDKIHIYNLGPENINDLIMLVEQRTKIAALDGRFDESLKALIECWKIAQHYTNPKLFLGPQGTGMRIKEQVLDMAFMILDCFAMDGSTLLLWQEQWQNEFKQDKYPPAFQTQRLFYFDYIQKNFVYDPEGKGRLDPKQADKYECLGGHINPRRSCEIGPTSKELSQMVDYICEHYEKYGNRSPWYWYYPEQKFQKEIEEWKAKHPIPDVFVPYLKPFWIYYHRLKAKSDALITVLALQRYKIDYGHYPKNLGAMRGYLVQVPQDPFSEGDLVYHWMVDDFELYSVGPDFEDNGGRRFRNDNPFSIRENDKGDDVFWPPFRLNRENVKFYPSRDPRPRP